MNPNHDGTALAPAPTTKVSIIIVTTLVIVSFLGMLPKFSSYFVLSLSAFSLPFPKFWVLITGTFYEKNILFGLFSALIIIMVAKKLEPLMGSKEFLRLYLAIGLYTNLLVLLFAGIVFLITKNSLIATRPFITSNAPMNSIFLYLAHEFITLKIPTMCGNIRVRMIPFYSFVLQLFFALFGQCDSLLTSIFSTMLTYLYIRYIKRNGRIRGDPSFSISKLLPSCGLNNDDGNDDNDDDNDGGSPPMHFGQEPDDRMDMNRFRFDNNANNQNNQNRTNRFQGTPHTLGH